MGKTELIIFLVAALIVYVESCSNSDDCWEGYCCIDGECTEDFSLVCNSCFGDSSCANGCCVDYKCKPRSSYACIEKNRCFRNSDCKSSCCKNNQCQELPCYVLPTLFPKFTSCSSNTDCYSSIYGDCCTDGHCAVCKYDAPTPSYDDHVDYGSSSSSRSGLSAGAYVGIGIAGVILVILKLALCASRCSRRERVVVVRRRITCVAVPIVNYDELQEEHERVMQPDRPPPAYSPRSFQDNIDSNGERPSRPPPEYSLNPPNNENEDANSTEIAQNQRSGAKGGVNSAGVVGTTDETNSVPPGNTITLPVASSSSPVGNLPQNNTGQNLTPINSTQRENATSVTDESNADPWNNATGPFVI